MANHEIRTLPIAVRVFPDRSDAERDIRSERSWRLPEGMLVFDTETRVDATQKLTFGSYRFVVAGECLEEGLFYGDDLPKADLRLAVSLSDSIFHSIFHDWHSTLQLLAASLQEASPWVCGHTRIPPVVNARMGFGLGFALSTSTTSGH